MALCSANQSNTNIHEFSCDDDDIESYIGGKRYAESQDTEAVETWRARKIGIAVTRPIRSECEKSKRYLIILDAMARKRHRSSTTYRFIGVWISCQTLDLKDW